MLMNTGVVTLEIAWARPIQARCTGPSRVGISRLLATNRPPMLNVMIEAGPPPRHARTPPRAKKAAPTVRKKWWLLPILIVMFLEVRLTLRRSCR